MSLKDVVSLSKQADHADVFGPILVSVFEALIRDTADLCDKENVDLDQIEAYNSSQVTDWQGSLLQIYENLYTADCLKVRRAGKAYASNKRGLPDKMVCYSKMVRPLLDFLDSRKQRLAADHFI